MTDHPAAWHPDPARRYQSRYWDGSRWTEHVANGPETATDNDGRDMANAGVTTGTGLIDGEIFGQTNPSQVQAQVAKAQTQSGSISDALTVPDGGSQQVPPTPYRQSIFTENILVVNQKAKIFELTNEYGIFNQAGAQIGAVREVGQSGAKKVARALLNVDALMTHTLDIVDFSGALQLRITKPRAMLKPKVIVENANGQELGELAIKLRIGKAQIKMLVGGNQVGMIYAENFRAWNFRIEDAAGIQIASITKTWEGLTKAVFTTADNYVLQIHQKLEEPVHSMVLASALAIDLILKQNDKGLL